MRRAKIVCTIGPATDSVETLVRLMESGMDMARLNLSHGNHDSHRQLYENIREAAGRIGRPVAILADLCGPKIRVGRVKGGRVTLEDQAEVALTALPVEGTSKRLPQTYEPLARDVRLGQPVLIDDGLVRLVVIEVRNGDVICRVEAGGEVADLKGINLPETDISTPALTAKDRLDLAFALELGVDFLALSFVRSADDVREAKALAGDVPVLAKIEKPEAIEDLEAILDEADGVMVARGDLGVECGHEKVPLIQKRIVSSIKSRAKPVITATQMLESMVYKSSPTRAEVSDVANAVLDGTDAVMLSAETSVGKYPVRAVEFMDSVIREVESSGYTNMNLQDPVMKDRSFSSAIAEAVTAAARKFDLKAMAVYTESGHSAALLSAERPQAHIIAFTRHDSVLNRLALYWGVKPIHGAWVQGVEGVVEQAERELLSRGLVKAGDDIAVTFGVRLGDEPLQTNILKLWKVRQDVTKPLARIQSPPC